MSGKMRVMALLGVLMLLAVAAVTASGVRERNAKVKTVEIGVLGKQFSYTPNRIRVNKGDRVVIKFVTQDVMHGFHLEGYGVDIKSWGGAG